MSTLLAASTLSPPSISYAAISPMLVVFGAATVGVLIEAAVRREDRWRLQVPVALLGLVGGLIACIVLGAQGYAGTGRGGHATITALGAVAVDGPTLFIQGTIAALGLACVLVLADREVDSGGSIVAQAAAIPGSTEELAVTRAGGMQTEVFPLAMFAIGGMMLFPASNDLLLMFVALEVLSLPLYLMCGLARRRRLLSQEAAVKYFLLGAFSSAFFLYGLALLYGYSGSVRLSDIAAKASAAAGNDALLYLGVALLGVGLLFKAGSAPFHQWTPDVYHGAPTPVTALMASGTKVAAFGALLRVFYVAFGNLRWDWRPTLFGVAVITMAVGAIVAITQADVKRMLAYSSVAHAGFILTGVVAATAGASSGLSGSLFYLITYGFTTVGAFTVVTLVRDADGEATHLSRWQGLGKRSPLIATIFAVFLLAFAGIPLTSGFAGKYAVFSAALAGGATGLVIVGLVSSAVAAFFYVRVIVLMFFAEPAPNGPTVAIPGGFTAAAIGLGLAVTVILGVYPTPLLHLANTAATFVR